MFNWSHAQFVTSPVRMARSLRLPLSASVCLCLPAYSTQRLLTPYQYFFTSTGLEN